MRFNYFNISKEEILKADILNTLNGGISQPRISVSRLENQYLLKAVIPGVEPDKIKVEIRNNRLYILHYIKAQSVSYNHGLKTIPFTVGYVYIPFDVDMKKINAFYEQGELIVNLPFNDFAGGYNHNISIERKD